MKLSKTALPQLLICTTCGKLKDSATWFIDSQCQRIDIRHYDLVGGRKIFERICNPCAVESTVHCYSSKPNLQHNGKKCFVCRLCARMFNPEDEVGDDLFMMTFVAGSGPTQNEAADTYLAQG